ncbi:MAG: peptidase, partial [bacterium]
KMMPIVGEVDGMNGRLGNDPFLGPGSVAVTRIECSTVSNNAIPDGCTITLDRRLTAGETATGAVRELELLPTVRAAGARVEVLQYSARSWRGLALNQEKVYPSWIMPEDHPLVLAGLEAGRLALGRRPKLDRWVASTNGVTTMGRLAIPTIGFGPADVALAHTPDEFVDPAGGWRPETGGWNRLSRPLTPDPRFPTLDSLLSTLDFSTPPFPSRLSGCILIGSFEKRTSIQFQRSEEDEMLRSGFCGFVVLSIVMAVATPVMAFLPADETAGDAWRHPVAAAGMALDRAQMLTQNAPSAAVVFGEDGGTVRALVGKLAPAARGNAEQIARDYVRNQFPGCEFELISSKNSGLETHVRFAQKLAGRTVFGNDLAVHVARDGSIGMVNGSVLPAEVTFVNKATLEAGQIAKAALKALGAGRITAPVRTVYPAAEGARHAWRLTVRTPAHAWLAVLDAETAEVLMAADQIQTLDGKGSVYKVSPLGGDPTVEVFPSLEGT